jgi:hypothetical protein
MIVAFLPLEYKEVLSILVGTFIRFYITENELERHEA